MELSFVEKASIICLLRHIVFPQSSASHVIECFLWGSSSHGRVDHEGRAADNDHGGLHVDIVRHLHLLLHDTAVLRCRALVGTRPRPDDVRPVDSIQHLL